MDLTTLQGYYFSKPLAACEIEGKFLNNNWLGHIDKVPCLIKFKGSVYYNKVVSYLRCYFFYFI